MNDVATAAFGCPQSAAPEVLRALPLCTPEPFVERDFSLRSEV